MRTQEIELNGASFYYKERGQGEPMVLVHANISDLRSWEPLEPLLEKHFRVISYSRRFAYPNRPIEDNKDDPMPAHAEDLIALIEFLGVGKVHLVGNSSGAFICLLVAQRRPDLVRTLTLEEPPVVSLFLKALPPKLGEVLKLLLVAPATLVELLKFGAGTIGPATKLFRQGKNEDALERFARGVLGNATFGKLSDARRQQMKDNMKQHRAALLGSGLPVFTEADAAAINIPTQLLRGSSTPAFQQRINERLAQLIAGAADVCIAEASHLVHEDNPIEVADAIRTFCQRPA